MAGDNRVQGTTCEHASSLRILGRASPIEVSTYTGLKMAPRVLLLPFGGVRLALLAREPHTYYATYLAGEWRGLRIRRGDLVIDAGANIGDFTVRASRAVGPEGRVLAIEPSAESRALLAQNVLLNGAANVTISAAALSDRPSLRWYSASGSYLVQSPDGEAGSSQLQTEPLGAVMARAGFDRADVIKMDIEGAEVSALRDVESLRGTREIGVETHSPDSATATLANLRDAGFTDVRPYSIADALAGGVGAVLSHPMSIARAELETHGYASGRFFKLFSGYQDIPALRRKSGIKIYYARRRPPRS